KTYTSKGSGFFNCVTDRINTIRVATKILPPGRSVRIISPQNPPGASAGGFSFRSLPKPLGPSTCITRDVPGGPCIALALLPSAGEHCFFCPNRLNPHPYSSVVPPAPQSAVGGETAPPDPPAKGCLDPDRPPVLEVRLL